MRLRRLRREPAGLDVTAFINLIVVLVPFLLSTAVFTRIAVLDLALPSQSTGALEQLSVEKLNLEVVIRGEAIEVGDRIGDSG
jgi:biopolymer transport protein ExbD